MTLCSAEEKERLLLVLGMLSPRQRQVAELMIAGCSQRDIARRLRLSRGTVQEYIRRLRQIAT
jgi:RNA polymerase sigma factor (sigma-70 family)